MPRWKRYNYDKMAERAVEAADYDSPTVVAVDTETSGFAWDDEAFCVTLSWRSPYSGKLRSFYIDLDTTARKLKVQYILADCPVWVFHNAKFDLQKLQLAGILHSGFGNWGRIEDTNIIHALLDENDRHGLKYLAKKLLGEETNEEGVLKKVRRKLKIKKDEGYHLLPRNVVVPYAMKDTEFTLRLYELLRPRLADELLPLYDAELDTALALLGIEGQGIALDVEYLRRAASEHGVELMKLESKLQELALVPDDPAIPAKKFNPNSPKQILEALDRRGVSVLSTDKATLATKDDELCVTLLEYRRVKKLHSTYLVPMLAEQRDGIIHPNFNLTLPRTGRMSSSGATNN